MAVTQNKKKINKFNDKAEVAARANVQAIRILEQTSAHVTADAKEIETKRRDPWHCFFDLVATSQWTAQAAQTTARTAQTATMCACLVVACHAYVTWL